MASAVNIPATVYERQPIQGIFFRVKQAEFALYRKRGTGRFGRIEAARQGGTAALSEDESFFIGHPRSAIMHHAARAPMWWSWRRSESNVLPRI